VTTLGAELCVGMETPGNSRYDTDCIGAFPDGVALRPAAWPDQICCDLTMQRDPMALGGFVRCFLK